uniref:DUF1725 domain-containing protein n=1 Tax=Rousettus aegyptiacus TaxID=9407 RepID=A0A7J8DIG8_ROUAE|nr:hypothetical protein HJG63_008617 [Rousettus aegyptiacus]
MWKKESSPTLLMGLHIGTTTMENSLEVSQKIIIRKDLCTPIFIAAQFTIAKIQKQSKCPSTDDWIMKLWFIYTMEYYSAIKRNEILPFATTWMDLEVIMLSAISQTEKDKYHMISLMWKLRNNKKETNQKQTHKYKGQSHDGQR